LYKKEKTKITDDREKASDENIFVHL